MHHVFVPEHPAQIRARQRGEDRNRVRDSGPKPGPLRFAAIHGLKNQPRGMGSHPVARLFKPRDRLSRAAGELIKVLDADDQLAPGTLARDIGVLSAQPGIGWTAARVLDLLPDGSTAGFDSDPAEGRIERGQVLEQWRARGYRPPVHPATLCVRRELLLAMGGWMALPASGDTGLLLALNAISPGYFIADTGLLYRKWPGQMTSQAAHTDEVEWPARMAIIEARAEALTALWDR